MALTHVSARHCVDRLQADVVVSKYLRLQHALHGHTSQVWSATQCVGVCKSETLERRVELETISELEGGEPGEIRRSL